MEPIITEFNDLSIQNISDFTYDLKTSKLIYANNDQLCQINLQTNEEHLAFFKDPRDSNPEVEQPQQLQELQQQQPALVGQAGNSNNSLALVGQKPKAEPLLSNISLRFCPANSSPKLQISASGLLATATSDQEEQLAITNFGVNKGLHYVEFFCPISSIGVQVGIIKENWNLTQINQNWMDLVAFKCTTPRVIGLRLDFKNNEMKCWLNGQLQQAKTKRLNPGTWYLCAKLKDQGNQVILNPFAVDIERPFSIYNNSDIVKESIKIEIQEESEIRNLFKEAIIAVQKSEGKEGTVQQPVQKPQDSQSCEISDCNKLTKLKYLPANNNIILIQGNKIKLIRKDQDDNFPFNITTFANKPVWPSDLVYLIMKCNQLEQILLEVNWTAIISEYVGIREVKEFLEACKKCFHQLFNQVSIKLPFQCAKKVVDGLQNYAYKQFIELNKIFQCASSEKPDDLNSLIKDIKDESPFTPVVKQTQQQQQQAHFQQSKTPQKQHQPQAQAYPQQQQQQQPNPISSAGGIAAMNQTSESHLQQQQQQTATAVVANQVETQQQQPVSQVLHKECVIEIYQDSNQCPKGLSLERASQILQTVLQLDEQLYAMHLHERTSPELRSLFPPKFHRLHSGFGRLASLLGYTNTKYPATELAEAGVFNTCDIITDLRHFEYPRLLLDHLENIRNDRPLWSNLKDMLPFSRFLSDQENNVGLPPNVPLYITINSLPYQTHTFRDQKNNNIFADVLQKTQRKLPTNYISLTGYDGSCSIWNTQLSLLKVYETNFFDDLRRPSDELLSVLCLRINERDSLGLAGAPKIYKILENCLSESTRNALPPSNFFKVPSNNDNLIVGASIKSGAQDLTKQKLEEEVEPNPQHVEQLYNMGFEVHLAKKAVQLTKNQGVQQALDIIFQLQDEENLKKESKPVSTNISQVNKPTTTEQTQSKNEGSENKVFQIFEKDILEDDFAPKLKLRQQWNCIQCTFLNENQVEAVCSICNSPAPPEAYYSEPELIEIKRQKIQVQQEQYMHQKEVELQEEARRKAEARQLYEQLHEEAEQRMIFRSLLTKSTVKTSFQVSLQNCGISGILVGCGFNCNKEVEGKNRSLLRIRRFAYNPKYLQRFIKQQNSLSSGGSNNSGGFICTLNGEWYPNDTIANLEAALMQNSNNRFVVEVLEPLFLANCRYADKNQRQDSFFNSEWVELEDYDFLIDDEESIIDSNWTPVSTRDKSICKGQEYSHDQAMTDQQAKEANNQMIEQFYITILTETKNKSYRLHVYLLTVDSSDPYGTQEKCTKEASSDFIYNSGSRSGISTTSVKNLEKEKDDIQVLQSLLNNGNVNNQISKEEFAKTLEQIRAHRKPSSIKVQLIHKIMVSGPGCSSSDSKIYVPDNCDIALLVTNNKWISIPFMQGFGGNSNLSIQVTEIKEGVQHASFISKDLVAILDKSRSIKVIEISSETPFTLQRAAKQTALESAVAIPRPLDMSAQDIQRMQHLLSTRPLGVAVYNADHSSHFDSQNQMYSRRTWMVPHLKLPLLDSKAQQHRIAYTIQFEQPSIILSLMLGTLFESNEGSTHNNKQIAKALQQLLQNRLQQKKELQQSLKPEIQQQQQQVEMLTISESSSPSSMHVLSPLIQKQQQQQQSSTVKPPANVVSEDEQNTGTQHQVELTSGGIGMVINSIHSQKELSQYKQKDLEFIPLMVKRFNGAPYNINFQASQMLYPIAGMDGQLQQQQSSSASTGQQTTQSTLPQSSGQKAQQAPIAVSGQQQNQPSQQQKIFVTNYPSADFIFQNLHEKLMLVEAVVVHSAFSTQQSGYPIGQGLIFTANSIGFFDVANMLFEDMQPEQYYKWRELQLQQAQGNWAGPEYWEPVGAFAFNEHQDKICVELDFKRPTQYIFLKPTQFRKKPTDYTKHYKTDPIEIRFFGVLGSTLEESDLAMLEKQSIQQPNQQQQQSFFLDRIAKMLTVEVNKGSLQQPDWMKLDLFVPPSVSSSPVEEKKVSNSPLQKGNRKLFLNNCLRLKQDVIYTENYLHKYFKLQRNRLSPQEEKQIIQCLIASGVCVSANSQLTISSEVLKTTFVSGIRVYVDQDAEQEYAKQQKAVFSSSGNNDIGGIESNQQNLVEDSTHIMDRSEWRLSQISMQPTVQASRLQGDYSKPTENQDIQQSSRTNIQQKKKEQAQLCSALLRSYFLDFSHYNVFNAQLVQLVSSRHACLEQRKAAISTLTKLIAFDQRFAQKIADDLDIPEFIKQNILVLRSSWSCDEVLHFLQILSEFPSFIQRLMKILVQMLTCLSLPSSMIEDQQGVPNKGGEITPEGLSMYFRILRWLQNFDRQVVCSELLSQLHKVAIRIKELRNPLYNILRTHFDISARVFEPDLFCEDSSIALSVDSNDLKETNQNFSLSLPRRQEVSRQNTSKSNCSKLSTSGNGSNTSPSPISFIRGAQHPMIKTRFVNQKSSMCCRITIDLMSLHQVRQVMLVFGRNVTCFTKFKVQMWAVTRNDYSSTCQYQSSVCSMECKSSPQPLFYHKRLLHSQRYTVALFKQLASYSNEEAVYSIFNKSHSNLDALGYTGLENPARYLIIQVSWNLQPHIATSNESKNKPNIDIIPVVFGDFVGDQLAANCQMQEEMMSPSGEEDNKTSAIPEFNALFTSFEKNNIKFVKELKVLGQYTYDKFEVFDLVGLGTMTQVLYDSLGLYRTGQQITIPKDVSSQVKQPTLEEKKVAQTASIAAGQSQNQNQDSKDFLLKQQAEGSQCNNYTEQQVCSLREQLQQKQSELKEQLREYKQMVESSPKQPTTAVSTIAKIGSINNQQQLPQQQQQQQLASSKRLIHKLCSEIKQIQLQLLKIKLRCGGNNSNTYNNKTQLNCSQTPGDYLDYLYTLTNHISGFLQDLFFQSANGDQGSAVIAAAAQSSEHIVKVTLDLFDTFVIFEDSVLSKSMLELISAVFIDNMVEKDWQVFVFRVIKSYLTKPVSLALPSTSIEQIYSQHRVINSLDYISIPLGEVLTYLYRRVESLGKAQGLVLNYKGFQDTTTQSKQQSSPQKKDVGTSESGLLNILAVLLVLLTRGYRKIPLEVLDLQTVSHKGAYCFSCLQSKPIAGARYKCANCPNVDCCSLAACQQKHLSAFPTHTFLIIEEPLPLPPERHLPVSVPPLLPQPFEFAEPSTDVHTNIKCECCSNQIEGARYMCANCEDYSLCEKCYNKKEQGQHAKYHVFFKLMRALMLKEPAHTPKILVQFLDPFLYPLHMPFETAGHSQQVGGALNVNLGISTNNYQQQQLQQQQGFSTPTQRYSKSISRELNIMKEKGQIPSYDQEQLEENQNKPVQQKETSASTVNANQEETNKQEEKPICDLPALAPIGIKRSISQPSNNQREKTGQSYAVTVLADSKQQQQQEQGLDEQIKPRKLTIIEEEEQQEDTAFIEVLHHLDYDQSLRIVFDLNAWITEFCLKSAQYPSGEMLGSSLFEEKKALHLMSLDLINEIMKLSSMSGLRELLSKNEQAFYRLCLNNLSLNQQTILEQFQECLKLMIRPKNMPPMPDEQRLSTLRPAEKQKLLAEHQALAEAQLTLIFYLQTLLQWVLSYAYQPTLNTPYSTLMRQLDTTNNEIEPHKTGSNSSSSRSTSGQWQFHLTFLLEFLLSSTDIVSKHIKDVHALKKRASEQQQQQQQPGQQQQSKRQMLGSINKEVQEQLRKQSQDQQKQMQEGDLLKIEELPPLNMVRSLSTTVGTESYQQQQSQLMLAAAHDLIGRGHALSYDDYWLLNKIHCQSLSEFIQRSFLDAEASISLQTALSLLNLIFPEGVYSQGDLTIENAPSQQHRSFSQSDSINMWSLVLKSVSKLKISLLLEAQIFERLVHSFLCASADVQQAVIGELLVLTQNLLSSPSALQKELFLLVMNLATLFAETIVKGQSTEQAVHQFIGSSPSEQNKVKQLNVGQGLSKKQQQPKSEHPDKAVQSTYQATLVKVEELGSIGTSGSMSLSLLKGWLDILLTHTSPKPEEYYQKPMEKAFCKFNEQGTLALFNRTSRYLMEHINLGGIEGVKMATPATLVKLEIGMSLLKILVYAESGVPGQFALSAFFSQFNEAPKDSHVGESSDQSAKEISAKKELNATRRCLQRCLKWYLMNRAPQDGNDDKKNQLNSSASTISAIGLGGITSSSIRMLQSPATEMMRELSTLMLRLFMLVSDNEEAVKIGLAELIIACKQSDSTLFELFKQEQISSATTTLYASKTCKILEELFNLWVTSDALAKHVAFEVKGFEYLLDRMGINRMLALEKNNQLLQSKADAFEEKKDNGQDQDHGQDQDQSHETQAVTQGSLAVSLHISQILKSEESLFTSSKTPDASNKQQLETTTQIPQPPSLLQLQALQQDNLSQKTQQTQQQQQAKMTMTTPSLLPQIGTQTAAEAMNKWWMHGNSSASEELRKEEFASNINVVHGQPGQQLTESGVDWSHNKKGLKQQRILTIVMNGQQFNECQILVKLEKLVDIKEVSLGFTTYAAELMDVVLGSPASVVLEGGLNSTELVPLGQLLPLGDEGYSSIAVRVFVKNFNTIKCGGVGIIGRQSNAISEEVQQRLVETNEFQTAFSSFSQRPVQYLRLRIRRPVITFIEGQSALSGSMYKNVGVSISFLSVMGYDASRQAPARQRQRIVDMQEESALQVIGKLCNQTFAETLSTLANNIEIVNKIKGSFQSLSKLLVTHEEWLQPVFLAIAANNQEMGDWMIEDFLNLNRSSQHAKMVAEIISSAQQPMRTAFPRLQRMHIFILHEITNIVQQLNKDKEGNIQQSFQSLVPFIEQYFNALHIVAKDYSTPPVLQQSQTQSKAQIQNQNQTQIPQQYELKLSPEDVPNLLKLFGKFSSVVPHLGQVIIKLFVTLMYLPRPFALTDGQQYLHSALDTLLLNDAPEQCPNHYEMAAPLIIGSETGVHWLLDNGAKHLEKIVNSVVHQLEKLEFATNKTLVDIQQNIFFGFYLLNTLVQNDIHVRTVITERLWHLKLYNAIKIMNPESPRLLKELTSDILKLLVQFLKNAVIYNPVNETRFATQLKNDISLLGTKRDMLFISNFLIPMLNVEATVPVCLHPYDSINQRWMLEGKKIFLYARKRLQQLSQQQQLNSFVNQEIPQPEESGTTLNLLASSLKSGLLSTKQRISLIQAMQTVSTRNKSQLFNKMQLQSQANGGWQLAMRQNKDSDPSLLDAVQQKVLKHAPFLILLEGTLNNTQCVFGVFSAQGQLSASNAHNSQLITNQEADELLDEQQYYPGSKIHYIPYSRDSMFFYYDDQSCAHFPLSIDTESNIKQQPNNMTTALQQAFGIINFTEDGGGYVSFVHNSIEWINLSFAANQNTYVDFDINVLPALELKNTAVTNLSKAYDLQQEFILGQAEYWVFHENLGGLGSRVAASDLEKLSTGSGFVSSLLSGLQSNLLFPQQYYNTMSSLNFFRPLPVYELPSTIQFQQLVDIITVSNTFKLNDDTKKYLQLVHTPTRKALSLSMPDHNVTLRDLQLQSSQIVDLEFDAVMLYQGASKTCLSKTLNNFTEGDIQKKTGTTATTVIDQQQPQQYKQEMRIFEVFDQVGGVQQIIEVTQKSLETWKNKERMQHWRQYIQELFSFSQLPHFFSLFMKNKDGLELLFQLLAGMPDEESSSSSTSPQKANKTNVGGGGNIGTGGGAVGSESLNSFGLITTVKNWEEEEQKASRFCYQILSDVFRVYNDAKIREFALEKEFVDRILGRIQLVSKEVKREWVDDAKMEDDEEAEEEQKKQQQQQEQQQSKGSPEKGDVDDGKKKVVKKKGVYYASDSTGQNSKWNTQEYVDTKKNRSEQLQSLIGILETFLNFKDWVPPKKLLKCICSSSLLPLLETTFRSGSLLEMSKDLELVFSYLRVVRVIAEHQVIVPTLLDLDPHYQPRQVESIYTLLKQLNDTAKIFLQCLSGPPQQQQPQSTNQKILLQNTQQTLQMTTTATTLQQPSSSSTTSPQQPQITEENKNAERLANEIIDVFSMVEKACIVYMTQLESQEQNDEEKRQNDLAEEQEFQMTLQQKPLAVKYRMLLKDLRFDYVSMKDNSNKYKHHYATYITPNSIPPQSKMIRLAQELADISNALPIDHTNSIFVRCDTDRVDVMKCCIMGAKGTPYAHGAFIYDVYLEDSYPQGPPKVNLSTTGSGKVRFNPNLYSCGKVCLSLLGTWRGNASENWDPKISTLLQVFMSLQAIIMSEEVYFNEPGFESEAGTEEGERKNEAYSNIVRYCNIKFAMIGAIKQPTPGFETIIKLHFYLKKDEILEECQKWIKYAEVREASYAGLVNDHNSYWVQEFKKEKKRYKEMLVEAVAELEKELDKLTPPTFKEFKSFSKSGSSSMTTASTRAKKKRQQDKKKLLEQQQSKNKQEQVEEPIDVTYDDTALQQQMQQSKELDIMDEKVKDRYSRYIGAMGIDAVAKQSACSVFLSGLGPLGVEIAKNTVLSGVKRLTMHDSRNTSFSDLSGQFFLSEADICLNRAGASLSKVQQLNYYVKVDLCACLKSLPLEESNLEKDFQLHTYNAVILTESDYSTQCAVDAFCRKRGIKFLAADVCGPWSRFFNDFGDNFTVLDKNGEDPVELIVHSISNEEHGKVILLPGSKHPFEDGDTIIIQNVEGMMKSKNIEQLPEKQQPEDKENKNSLQQKELEIVNEKVIDVQENSINGTIHKIKVINSNSFIIGDTRGYAPYVRSGTVRNIKVPVECHFLPLEQCCIKTKDANNQFKFSSNNPPVVIDPMMQVHDFAKTSHSLILHACFEALQEFISIHSRSPKPWDYEDAQTFLKIALPYAQAIYMPKQQDQPQQQQEESAEQKLKQQQQKQVEEEQQKQTFEQIAMRFSFTCAIGSFPPLAAFLGGYVTQELLKAITQKYMPTRQLFYSDCIEVLPNLPKETEALQKLLQENTLDVKPRQLRTDSVRILLGSTNFKLLQQSKLFMVGCGAIGCELLKNFAMLSLCTEEKGNLTITDPDHIENSNLSRQFLFREKHLRKPKSKTSAAAVIQMNPLLKGHIDARLDKVHEGTVNIFSEKFFTSLDVVTNALDNIAARRYVDSRCVSAKIPLLESGTLGPKGHVQVIVPYKTESYGSQQDPGQEEGEIPHCTLKSFPEETLHCVEWARDKFGKFFTQRPKAVNKILEDPNFTPTDGSDLRQMRQAVKLIMSRPTTFQDCIIYAIRKFYKYFRNDVAQLLYTYPLTTKTKDGEPFWKLPKRPPEPISKFDVNNQLHSTFVSTLAVLRARTFNIPYPKDFRSQKERESIAEDAAKFKISDFQPSDQKAKALSTQVEKEESKKDPKQAQQDEEQKGDGKEAQQGFAEEAKQLKEQLDQLVAKYKPDFIKQPQQLQMQTNQQQQPVLCPEEFEKDEDSNGHIDFIYAMANCRSSNYKLVPMDWITVKLKAGRIVPALATTTAAIAGLQTIELVKLLKREEKIENMKNGFLNLAVPMLQLSEPGAALKVKLHENLSVTLWDRWDVKKGKDLTLSQLFQHLTDTYKLKPCDVICGAKSIYSAVMMNKEGNGIAREILLNTKLIELLDFDDEDSEDNFADLMVTFQQLNGQGDILKDTPLVRVYFNK